MCRPYAKESQDVTAGVQALMKSQRRVRGVVTCMDQGRCALRSEYGRFSFDTRSVKPNKNHPERDPQIGDACEFRLSHHLPPTAVSIRISVPKQHNPLTMQTCYTLLEETCGGVTSLLYQLEGSELRHSVCVLYLLTRVLDCVQDSHLKNKSQLLTGPLETLPDTNLIYSVEAFDKKLIMGLPSIYNMLRSLPVPYQESIQLAVQRRGEGLSRCGKDKVCEDMAQFEECCWAVGGLVWEGLSGVFGVQVGSLDKRAANSCGVFVTKCHSLRSPELGVKRPSVVSVDNPNAVSCTNFMVCDAMSHLPDCLGYIHSLRSDPHVFRFVAVPFLLAVCTLYKVWSSPTPYRGSSLGRDLSLHVMNMRNPEDFITHFGLAHASFTRGLHPSDPYYETALQKAEIVDVYLA
eukprot:TRINITY_DN902_c5_g1_i1.p1 TRINITY_DN902_c5_g1~~TRINITY_DN902_c5_g1_i1.p1  ORF type:complete len:424 (+),score=74.08 TRINITY_DN902_c5_g1_i1:58-1272(+)